MYNTNETEDCLLNMNNRVIYALQSDGSHPHDRRKLPAPFEDLLLLKTSLFPIH